MKARLVYIAVFSLLFGCCDRNRFSNEFPRNNYETIVAYKMSGEEGEVVENGKISDKVLGEGEVLTERESRALRRIFHDRSTYGQSSYLCFEPHVGYVFYSREHEIVAYTTICLECNWMKQFPEVGGFAFSTKGNQRLADVESKIFGN